MKKITDFSLADKRVLLRCDFNVPLNEKREVEDDFRIEITIPTIEYILKQKGKVILLSHLGRPAGKKEERFSLGPVQDKLVEYLDFSVVKAEDCTGPEIEKWTKEMQAGEVLLLENLRFHRGEESNDKEFARRLARLGDVYINEAFSVSHRNHASVVSLPRLLLSGVGFVFLEELKVLKKVRQGSQRPVVGIIGGAKVEEKLKPVPKLLELADLLLIGGKTGEVLRKYEETGKIEPGLDKIVRNIDLKSKKLFITRDGVYQNQKICDIGPETVRLFKEKIEKANTVFWAGPVGNTDLKEFEQGSKEIAEAVGAADVFSVAGGGDTASFLRKRGMDKSFNHISTGGSSMLHFLSEGTLPGLEALNSSQLL